MVRSPRPSELIAGFWLWQVKSKEEALEWLKRAPFQEGEVELRQVSRNRRLRRLAMTPEMRAQEERLRAQRWPRRSAIRDVIGGRDGHRSPTAPSMRSGE